MCTLKVTYKYERTHEYMTRSFQVTHVSKEKCIHENVAFHTCLNRRTQETYAYEKRPVYMKTDLEKRKLIHVIRFELAFEKLYACK